MRRAWAGVALLSATWLFGLSYYHEANWPVWGLILAAGVLVLMGVPAPVPDRRTSIAAALMLVPVTYLAPWPYRAGVLLLMVGLGLHALPVPQRWPRSLASGAMVAGVILIVQTLGMLAYTDWTAHSHDLPRPLAHLLGTFAGWSGIDAASGGSEVALHSMRQVHRLAPTWELLLDPPTLCFVVGGIALLVMVAWARLPRQTRAGRFVLPIGGLLISVLVWLPFRAALLMGLYMHRVLRTEYGEELNVMNQFWNAWLIGGLLVVPMLMAWRFSRLPAAQATELPVAKGWRRVAAAGLAFAAVVALTVGVFWDPVGERKPGRVFVDEARSDWEPTEKPYDTEFYGHMSGYNYYCVYDYCSRFYEMSRIEKPKQGQPLKRIDDQALADCDVLILKSPTKSYTADEVDVILRFIERGGGVMLVGEHTDVFGTSRNLNLVARRLGFAFRHDCLFGVDSFFDQIFTPGVAPHPIVQHMPPMYFATSCSIDPGSSSGRAPILETGLKNLPAHYHASNFYPQAEDRADMRYGAFVQLWSVRHGKGRVVAFSDSTIFSNFSTFEPGKIELMLGMIEWLNHTNTFADPRPYLMTLGIVLLLAGLWLARPWDATWAPFLAAGLLGWVVGTVGVRAGHAAAMPAPTPVRDFVKVLVDRTVSDVRLPKGGFIGGKGEGFGIFDRWILRLGYFTVRAGGPEAIKPDVDLVVVLHPRLGVSDAFRKRLVRYVDAGGRLLVLDSPSNSESTANSLIHPFGIEVDRQTDYSGPAIMPKGWPVVPIKSACEVKGGQPLVMLGTKTVAASIRHGKGTVTVIGFGARFNNDQMGVTGDVVPGPDLRKVYDVQFSLLRAIVEDRIPAVGTVPGVRRNGPPPPGSGTN